ncbi:MAG: hypothetical protein ACLGXA_08035 [Acidobacteriota bacterium]
MRSTHTYAVLTISPEAHAEITAKLLAARYAHAIHGETIDMKGIALEPQAEEKPEFIRVVAPGQEIQREIRPIDIAWEPTPGEVVTVNADSVDEMDNRQETRCYRTGDYQKLVDAGLIVDLSFNRP